MPHDKVIKDVFYFDELSEEAKEKARSWYREGALDYEWWEFVYEDFERIANILGVEFDRSPTTRRDGTPGKGRVHVFFSGFSSQGDGACFEGTYRYSPGWKKALLEYAPKDEKLFRIGKALQDAQATSFYKLTAQIKHRGHYHHSGCMDIEVYSDASMPDGAEDDIIEALRDLANWLYRTLEKEYEYLISDEQVDESIKANEYEFNENGRRV